MQIVVIGLNHQVAPVEVRTRLSALKTEVQQALAELARRSDQCESSIVEGVILATCNRAELYAVVSDVRAGTLELLAFLGQQCHLEPGELEDYLYRYEGERAVAHLFSVAAGLDSLVVGENEVLGQVREAFHLAVEEKAARAILSRLFRAAITVGKRARTETEISRNAASVSSVAVELSKRIYGDLSNCRAFVIGSGEMGTQALQNLVLSGVRQVLISNRTRAKAEALAREYEGVVVDFDRIHEALAEVDVVIACTAAPHPIVHCHQVREAASHRTGRPLFVVDIAVPPNVEPGVRDIENVFLYDIDDLQQVLEDNLARRRGEIPKVRRIIDEEIERFVAWHQSLDVVPTIVDLRRHAEQICQMELEKAMRRLGPLDERQRSIVEALAVGVVNKMLHNPIVCLKQRATEQGVYQYTAALQELFGLDNGKGHG